jgi:hypothetical protein
VVQPVQDRLGGEARARHVASPSRASLLQQGRATDRARGRVARLALSMPPGRRARLLGEEGGPLPGAPDLFLAARGSAIAGRQLARVAEQLVDARIAGREPLGVLQRLEGERPLADRHQHLGEPAIGDELRRIDGHHPLEHRARFR